MISLDDSDSCNNVKAGFSVVVGWGGAHFELLTNDCFHYGFICSLFSPLIEWNGMKKVQYFPLKCGGVEEESGMRQTAYSTYSKCI